MDMKTKQRLILLIASGIHDIQSLRQHIPNLTDLEISYLLFAPSETERLISEALPRPHFLGEHYEIHPNDELVLSDAGRDMLYQIRREQQAIHLQKLSLFFSAIAALCSGISLIIAILQLLRTS